MDDVANRDESVRVGLMSNSCSHTSVLGSAERAPDGAYSIMWVPAHLSRCSAVKLDNWICSHVYHGFITRIESYSSESFKEQIHVKRDCVVFKYVRNEDNL